MWVCVTIQMIVTSKFIQSSQIPIYIWINKSCRIQDAICMHWFSSHSRLAQEIWVVIWYKCSYNSCTCIIMFIPWLWFCIWVSNLVLVIFFHTEFSIHINFLHDSLSVHVMSIFDLWEISGSYYDRLWLNQLDSW